MAIRLHQMHPALVHLPITLMPLAVGADLLGCIIGGKSLHSFGQKAIVLVAAGAGAAAVIGLIACEEVNVEGDARDMLMTHRNLNFAARRQVGADVDGQIPKGWRACRADEARAPDLNKRQVFHSQ